MIDVPNIFLCKEDKIEHRRTQVRKPRTNGFVERFNRTSLDEFFRDTFRDKYYVSIEELHGEEFQASLNHSLLNGKQNQTSL